MLGPEMARALVNQQLRVDDATQNVLADTIRIIEARLENSRMELRGVAAELDTLRRYHRQVLQDLPIGVCSLGPDGEIVIWNQAMVKMSRLRTDETVGLKIENLPDPWGELLQQFLRAEESGANKVRRIVDGNSRWFNLHKARLDKIPSVQPEQAERQQTGVVVIIEDLTETQLLEAELMPAVRCA